MFCRFDERVERPLKKIQSWRMLETLIFMTFFARAAHNVSADLSFFLLLSLSASMTMAHLALVLFSPEEGKGEPCVS